jgi:hypothetical protein
MSTAKSREQYIKVWNNHISELVKISQVFEEREDDALYYELLAIRRRLKEMVIVSADLEFGEE